jgi:hypothetical protein
MRFRIGLRTRIACPGDIVEVKPGVMHSFANAGDEEAQPHVEVRPALAMEDMLAEVITMARAGQMTHRGLPRNLLAPLVFAARHQPSARTAIALAGTTAVGLFV